MVSATSCPTSPDWPVSSPSVVALRRLERYTLPSGGIEIRGCSFVEVADGVVTRWADYKSMHAIDEIVG